jgi:hypothetical protein
MGIKDKRVTKVEHIWCGASDRWVYIEYNMEKEIVGLNYAQGDDYEYFEKHWATSDESLTRFYHAMTRIFLIERKSITTIDFINKVIWASVEAETRNQ